jgi:hypothetical protein
MRIGLVLVGLLAAGCGGAETRGAGHAHFREIQRREAEIDSHRLAAFEPGRSCDEACPATSAICEAAEPICDIGDRTEDRDAIARCTDARAICREARGGVGERCSCGGQSAR